MIAEAPKIPERVDHWLLAWAAWMRVRPSDEMELGYPSRVKPWIGGGESQRTDDWEESEAEKIRLWCCETMNKLIKDLPLAQQCAIGHIYAGECWRFPRENKFKLLEDASQALLIGMNKWEIM